MSHCRHCLSSFSITVIKVAWHGQLKGSGLKFQRDQPIPQDRANWRDMGKLADHIVSKFKRQSWTGTELGLCSLKAHPPPSGSIPKKPHNLPKVHQQLRSVLVFDHMSPWGTLDIKITIGVSHLGHWYSVVTHIGASHLGHWYNVVILKVYAQEPPWSCYQQNFKIIFNVFGGFMASLLGHTFMTILGHMEPTGCGLGTLDGKFPSARHHQYIIPWAVSKCVSLLPHVLNSKQKGFGYWWL